MSSWNALLGEVNTAISKMNTAASGANAAATQASEAAQRAQTATQDAQQAAAAADDAAAAALAEKAIWKGATFSVTTLDQDAQPTFEMSEKDGAMHLVFGVPVGRTGADGKKGETGESGVSFTLTGTVLYIATN